MSLWETFVTILLTKKEKMESLNHSLQPKLQHTLMFAITGLENKKKQEGRKTSLKMRHLKLLQNVLKETSIEIIWVFKVYEELCEGLKMPQ